MTQRTPLLATARRRQLPGAKLLTAAFLIFVSGSLAAAAPQPVALHWLSQPADGTTQSVSWGVPWPQGAVPRAATFNLTDAQGKPPWSLFLAL